MPPRPHLISVCVLGRGSFLPVAVEPTPAAKPTSPFVCNGCLPRFFAANADGTCALEFLKEAAPVPRFLRCVVGNRALHGALSGDQGEGV